MPRKSLPALSPTETVVLRVLWSLGSGTVQEVLDALPPTRRIAYATVQTLLRRLEAKGYITHETEGRAHLFRPAAEREDVIKRTVGDFVQRLFGGDPVPLMLHLAEGSGLSEEEVRRLKKLIDKGNSQLPRGSNDD